MGLQAFKARGGRACIKRNEKGQVEKEEEREDRAVKERLLRRRKLANNLPQRVGAGKLTMEECRFSVALSSNIREQPEN